MSHICFACTRALRVCVRIYYSLLWWRGGCPRTLERGGVAPELKPRLNFDRGAVTSKRCCHSLRVPAVAGHEKHRPSGVRTRRRQSPLIAMYSWFCPAERASPPWGAQAQGGGILTISIIFIHIFYFLLEHYCSNLKMLISGSLLACQRFCIASHLNGI